MRHKAVVLLSGGLDSAVTLYYAERRGYECHCLIFDYGQKHKKELILARKIAKASASKLKVVKLNLPWKGSSLLDRTKELPQNRTIGEIRKGIPSTYVPARNTIFLSMAASFAEAISANCIFIGAHFEDSSGYPDCRKGYLEAFQKVIRSGTRAGLEGRLKIRYPLIGKTKKDIIKLGAALSVPFQFTWSCYKGAAAPCMKCDSCILRARGFKEAGIKDPLLIGR